MAIQDNEPRAIMLKDLREIRAAGRYKKCESNQQGMSREKRP